MKLFENSSRDDAIKILKDSIQEGDVFRVNFSMSDGISPKDGYTTRKKYFIILGVDDDNIYGGVVFNSEINQNLSSKISEYQIVIQAEDYDFLDHKSYINCSKLIPASPEKLINSTKIGAINEVDLYYIKEKIKIAYTISPVERKRYHL